MGNVYIVVRWHYAVNGAFFIGMALEKSVKLIRWRQWLGCPLPCARRITPYSVGGASAAGANWLGWGKHHRHYYRAGGVEMSTFIIRRNWRQSMLTAFRPPRFAHFPAFIWLHYSLHRGIYGLGGFLIKLVTSTRLLVEFIPAWLASMW